MAAAQRRTKLPGAATLCVLEIDGTQLRAANLGDSGFRVIRDGEVVLASSALQYAFNTPYQLANEEFSDFQSTKPEKSKTYKLPVQPGDLIVAGSDGLFDNAFDTEIAKVATEVAGEKKFFGPLAATQAASDALARLARTNSQNKTYTSPFSQDWARSEWAKDSLLDKVKSVFIKGFYGGGKVDDTAVVVGMVVPTEEALTEGYLKDGIAASEELAKKREADVAEADSVLKMVQAQIGEAKRATARNIEAERAKASQDQVSMTRFFQRKEQGSSTIKGTSTIKVSRKPRGTIKGTTTVKVSRKSPSTMKGTATIKVSRKREGSENPFAPFRLGLGQRNSPVTVAGTERVRRRTQGLSFAARQPTIKRKSSVTIKGTGRGRAGTQKIGSPSQDASDSEAAKPWWQR
eukprot:gnl/MRDRNA2_/MRDRNA2_33275_c0_seq1.p1 gnl/MRDRNA2_/MRDRNA2_33275_c0~~gnl/MRDRNA2_/MRDRNA2_33275_c0_seq1.p1  ORF type:complete len:471 (+),score=91.01 gnl/MRDRNA2_/MRDRNA2_33275_c0_seq1:199-1413(+)